MVCVMREAKTKFKRVILLDEVEEEKEEKLPSTEFMNNVTS